MQHLRDLTNQTVTMMPADDAFGAFLRNYQPLVEDAAFLEKYLIDMGIKSPGVEKYTSHESQIYVEALERHFNRLNNFLISGQESMVNLVFGNVQSGKTRHLLANICWARDNAFHAAIVFTGSTTPLGDQTVDRLASSLPQNTAQIISSPTEPRLADGPVLQQLISRVQSRLVDTNTPLPVVTLIKSGARLSAVRSMIEELNRVIGTDLRIMILDDEADQASPDATAGSRGNEIVETILSQDPPTRVTIHNRINEIRDVIRGQHIYLAYTATPQALIHGDLDGPLQPEYCSVVPAGSDYTSIGAIVRQREALIRLNNADDSVSSDENMKAMEICFAQFLVLSWLHKRHANIFHGKSLKTIYKCDEKSIQFLIHPSGLSTDHQDFKDAMDLCLKDFKSYMTQGTETLAFLNEYFKPAYLKVLSKLPDDAKKLLESDEQKTDCWDYIIKLTHSVKDLKIKLVNYKERKNLSPQEPLVPITPSQWQEAEAWVLIGGEILGRGLSIPHLAITLFLRNPNNPNFDTAVQQMRFCGYRKSYLPLLQVYAPSDIVQDYLDAVEIDEPFRARALRWDLTNRNLRLNPPMLRFIAPATTRFRPTRNSVLSGEISVRASTSRSGFFSTAQISNPLKLIRNSNLILDLIAGLPIHDKYSINDTKSVVYSLDKQKINQLFLKWDLCDSEKFEFLTMFELLGYPEAERGLEHLECLLAVDYEVTKFASGEDAHSKYATLKDLPFRTLSASVSEADWTNLENTEKFDRLQAKSIVGGSERTMQESYPENVLLQCRLFELLNPSPILTGEGSRNREGRGIGMGLSLIGWIPDSDEEYYVNKEVGRSYARE
jgi:hypothetical protein